MDDTRTTASANVTPREWSWRVVADDVFWNDTAILPWHKFNSLPDWFGTVKVPQQRRKRATLRRLL